MKNTKQIIKISMYALLIMTASAIFAGGIMNSQVDILAEENAEIMEEFRKAKTEFKIIQTELVEAEKEVQFWREKRDENIKKQNEYINEEPPLEVVSSMVIEEEKEVNIKKLAYAIAMAETKDCTTGMGITKLNCFGIMTWETGTRTGKVYNSKDESYADFRRIWEAYYGGFPSYGMAKKWTGNDRPDNWLRIVTYYYNS